MTEQPVNFCPICGTSAKLANIVQICEWAATSKDDPENESTIIEYQCNGKCEGGSFWM